MPTLRNHTHCQVAQKSQPHEPKLVKEYVCPNASFADQKKLFFRNISALIESNKGI
jgi:hypothetical protein